MVRSIIQELKDAQKHMEGHNLHAVIDIKNNQSNAQLSSSILDR